MRLRDVEPGDVGTYVRMRCDPVMMAELGGPLPREGIEDKVGRLDRTVTLDGLLAANLEVQPASASVPGATTSPGL